MNNVNTPQEGTATIKMVQNYLTAHYLFKYNASTCRLLFKPVESEADFQYLTDYDFNSILKNVKSANLSCSKDLLRTVLFSDYVESFDPYGSFFSSLPAWDGIDYVARLADTVITTDPEHWKFCLKKWLVAMVASLMKKDVVNQTAIIFSGPQGIGKTRWFHSIIPPCLREFIFEGCIQMNDKETEIKLSECILILMDELENVSAKNIDSLKMLMTKKYIYMRRSFHYTSESYVRRASFAGTINKKEFLCDLSGNRRFLCFDVLDINTEHDIPLDQLYAQLVHLYQSGFQYWFDKKEIEILNEKNIAFRMISPEEEALSSCFEPCKIGEETGFYTTTEILQLLTQKTNVSPLSIQNLGKVLREMNFRRVKKKDRYGYLVKEKK